jgi:hypothetical protein
MIDYIIALFMPNTIIELSFLFLAFSLTLALPSMIAERRELEKYMGPNEWRVGKPYRY